MDVFGLLDKITLAGKLEDLKTMIVLQVRI
jgi:hypothetical protein